MGFPPDQVRGSAHPTKGESRMRPASAALVNYLAQNDTVVIVDLYTFALPGGVTLRYSGGATPLAIPGTRFPPGSLNYDAAGYTTFILGPRFARSKVSARIAGEPTALDISVLAGAGDLVGSFGFADAVRLGGVAAAPAGPARPFR